MDIGSIVLCIFMVIHKANANNFSLKGKNSTERK